MKFPAQSLVHKVPDRVHRYIWLSPCLVPSTLQKSQNRIWRYCCCCWCRNTRLGMIGAARLKNPSQLISIDLVDQRLDIAKDLGADVVLNPMRTDVIAKILEMTDGYGCDVYIEATGHPSAVEQGLHMIRKAGTFVEFSVMKEPVTVDWTIIGDTKELNIYGAHLGPHSYPLAIDYIDRGLIDVIKIATHQFNLSDYKTASTWSKKVPIQLRFS